MASNSALHKALQSLFIRATTEHTKNCKTGQGWGHCSCNLAMDIRKAEEALNEERKRKAVKP